MTEKYVIIICSAINIPEQSYDAQYQAGGEVRCETMSNVIVKENTMKSQAYDVKRSLKLLENANITNMCRLIEC